MEPNTLNPCVSGAPQVKDNQFRDLTPVRLKTREEVYAAREAFRKGGLWRHAKFLDGRAIGAVDDREYRRIAEQKYPMPKITVPREVKFTGVTYRFVNGRFEHRKFDGQWAPSLMFDDIAGLKALLGLIDNPTCEVDA